MPKDFTDYVLVIFDAGDRVYHTKHLWHHKGVELDHKLYGFNGYQYVLELDRAYKIKWRPWKHIIYTERTIKKTVEPKKGVKGAKPTVIEKKVKRFRPYLTVREFLRSKKIGVLWYQMPCTHKCASCTLRLKDENICSKLPSKVEPMHISKIHQPSGEMRE